MEVNNPNYSKQGATLNPRGKPIAFTSDGEVRSYHYDDVWNFLGTEAKGIGKKSTVSFLKTEPQYKRAIQDTLYELFKFYQGKDAISPNSCQLHSYKLGLEHIAKISGSSDWSLIDSERNFKRFKKQIKKNGLGQGTIETNIVTVLNKLSELGIISRFVSGRELVALAVQKVRKQNIAIPIGIYQQILSHAIATVETYHPFRHEIARVMEEAYGIRAKVESGENLLKGLPGSRPDKNLRMKYPNIMKRQRTACQRLIEHSIPDFDIQLNGTVLAHLQSVCQVVVFAFSGARLGECLSFNTESYHTKKTDGGNEISILRGETTKGNDGKPKIEVWQSHPIAKDALELAYDMTESLRSIYTLKIKSKYKFGAYNYDEYLRSLKEVNSAFIPVYLNLQQDNYVSSNISTKINKLMSYWDIKANSKDVTEFDLLNPSRDGELKVGGYLPKLTPHDFRRSFAVFFMRYGFGTASGIKFQYKHENINMSEYYANNADLMRMNDLLMDTELLRLMEEEGINLGVDIYDDIYNGSEHLSGTGGERIAQDKFAKMKSDQHVYMTRTEIESLVRNGSLAVVQLPTGGYCINPDCNRVCGMGLFPSEKKKCIHQVNTDKTAKKMAQQRKRLIVQFKGLNTGDTLRNSILVGIKQKIKTIEVMLNEHEIKYELFNDRVEGLING